MLLILIFFLLCVKASTERNSLLTNVSVLFINSLSIVCLIKSSIPVDAGDKSVVTYTSCYQFRLRLYNSNGDYYDNQYSFNATVSQKGYIRFVAHMGIGSFDSIKIVKPDGTEIDYKIIDMR